MANQSITLDYLHPYGTIVWEHRPTNGEWQDATNLSGYVSGQGTKTLTLSGASAEEAGHIRGGVYNPAGGVAYTRNAVLTGEAAPITFLNHPQNLELNATITFVDQPQNLELSATESAPEYLHDFTTKQIGAWNFSRDGNATAPDENGIIQTYTDKQPAWYRDQGLQLEDESTNELRSTDFLTSQWIKTSVTIDAHGTIEAPDGTLSSGHIHNILASGHSYHDGLTQDGWTESQWARTVTGTGDAHLLDRFHEANSLFSLDTTWTRFAKQAVYVDAFSTHQYCFDSRGSTTVTELLVWGPQTENSAFATSYIPAPAGSVTRAATSCTATFAELGDPLPAGGLTNDFCFQCVVYLTTDYPDIVATGNANRFISLNVGTVSADNVCELFAIGNDRVQGYIRKGATTYAINLWEAQFANLVAGDSFDFRLKISSTEGQKAWVTTKFGTISATHADTSGFSAALTQVDMNRAGNYKPAQTVWSKIRIVPEALTDEEIEAWT